MRKRRVGIRSSRHADAGRLYGIGINHEIDGGGTVAPRQAGQGEMLDPHTGMKQLGLMAGKNDMWPVNLGRRFTGLLGVARGFVE